MYLKSQIQTSDFRTKKEETPKVHSFQEDSCENLVSFKIVVLLVLICIESTTILKETRGGFICTFSLLSSLSFTFQSSKFNYSSSSKW